MSAPAQQAPGDAMTAPPGRRHRRRLRRRALVAVVVLVIIAGSGAGYYEVRHLHDSAPPATVNPDATALQPITRQSLSEQTTVNGTLGYSGTYTIVVPSASGGSASGGGTSSSGQGQSAGAYTWLPAAGQVVIQGEQMYAVAGSPVVLLYGSVPAYRSLSEGMTGTDVQQLNSDLVAMGYATTADIDPSSDYFGGATATALDSLQSHLGLTQTGTLPLGQAVFQPTVVRVGNVSATLGAPAQPGAPVLTGTSDTRQAVAQVDPTELPSVRVGASVTITLPSNRTTTGRVTSIGTTAAGSPPGGPGTPGPSSSSAPAATVSVDISLDHPAVAGTLDQAPITVSITTATVKNVLAVPIGALIAQPSGYAVEVAGPGGTRRIAPVALGLFDDAAGLVQVTGSGLAAGEQVVIPSI